MRRRKFLAATAGALATPALKGSLAVARSGDLEAHSHVSAGFAETDSMPPDKPWRPTKGVLLTRWAKDINPARPLPEYPRPQMVRERWLNLNGLWDYALACKNSDQPPVTYNGKILVPFPIESALSGVMKPLEPDGRLWYRRTFNVPSDWKGQRIWLHFGAVDWESVVYVNGEHLGLHRGGYDGFSYDITDVLKPADPQEVIVSVYDPTAEMGQVRGKQILNPAGASYTRVSGIWQTVWLEPLPEAHIAGLALIPDVNARTLQVSILGYGLRATDHVEISAFDGGHRVARTSSSIGTPVSLAISNPKLWWPNDPFLYDLRVTLFREEAEIDSIHSYFGMRKVSLAKDSKGFTRVQLNGEFVEQIGVLDQGYWPDGLYTAPTDDALRYDIEVMKKLGFVVCRKHQKYEPDRWYYWADKLGVMVWQDMPAQYNTPGDRIVDRPWSREAAVQFEGELKAMVDGRRNHPSIIQWTIFNEAWGQHDSWRLTKWLKQYDPTRLVDTASGFILHGVGDVNDSHGGVPFREDSRASVTGESGGWGLRTEGHSWSTRTWAYGTYDKEGLTYDLSDLNPATQEWFTQRYVRHIEEFRRRKDEPEDGRCGIVYTQLIDVETECDGMVSYDRAVLKVDAEKVAAINMAGSGQS